MDLMQNAVVNVSVGWCAVDLAGKLTDGFFVLVLFSVPSCISEEGATDELECSATPRHGSGRDSCDCSSGR
jgi:hypothetical protein